MPSSHLVKGGWEKFVGCWLVASAGMVFSMICIGGYTRLTGSGLSMVDWNFQGKGLPRNDEEWAVEFDKYKNYPEYKFMHGRTMDLEEFKNIYFIEWFHRMWGRSIGLLVAIPGLALAAKGALKPALCARLSGLFVLGASQGFIGWWMVRSGLEEPATKDRPVTVSPYRLTTHLAMALGLYGGVLWTAMNILRPYDLITATTTVAKNTRFLKKAALPGLIVSMITVLSGGFVAGNQAGFAYNTWPKMLDDWVPPEVITTYSNLRENYKDLFMSTPVVQFDHRILAYATVLSSWAVFGLARSLELTPACRKAAALVAIMPMCQAALGITTLLMFVPTDLGTLHQAGGIMVLSAYLLLFHTLRGPAGAAALAKTAAKMAK